MKHRKTVFTGIVALCAIGSAIWFSSVSGTVNEQEMVEPSRIRPVPTQRVTEIVDTGSRSFPGSVRATERVELAFSVDGLLMELSATEGTLVQKGDVVARLDDRDARNNYQAAKARYELTKKDFERSQALLAKKIIPPAEHDNARSSFDIAAAEMRVRKKALDDTVLIAPFNGIVARRYVENHQHIKAKDRILSLKDISVIDVVIQVPERLIAHGGGKRFDTVRVRFDAIPSQWYEAQIKEYSIEADALTHTYDVVVSLTPPEGVEIFPGMTATVQAGGDRTTTADGGSAQKTIVPLAAVVGSNDNNSFVWVIPEQGGRPLKRDVEVGTIRKAGIEIVSGLIKGELVAVAGVHSLSQEMMVRPAHPAREGLDQ